MNVEHPHTHFNFNFLWEWQEIHKTPINDFLNVGKNKTRIRQLVVIFDRDKDVFPGFPPKWYF